MHRILFLLVSLRQKILIMHLIARYTTDTEDRITLIRWTICLAYFASICVAPQLWFMQLRNMPACPVIKGFSIPDVVSAAFVICLAVSLMVIFVGKFIRWSIISAIAASVVLVLQDINRLQPQFYLFVLLLLFLLLYHEKKISQTGTIAAIQLIICGVYFWGGIHKLNDFYPPIFSGFIRAFVSDLPTGLAGSILDSLGYISPWVELLLPLAFLFLPFKKIYVAIVVFMHLFILAALSLYGVNYIVFPWNIMMGFISFVLFYNGESFRFSSFKNAYVVVITILLWILPVFSLFNKYDAFLSFDLYSGKYPYAYIYVRGNVAENLPETLYPHMEITKSKQYRINLLTWSEQEIKSPMYPAERVFKHYLRYIQSFANSRDEAGMVIFRNGKMKEVR